MNGKTVHLEFGTAAREELEGARGQKAVEVWKRGWVVAHLVKTRLNNKKRQAKEHRPWV